MRALLRPATVLLLCAATLAPAAADLGEIVKIEGDVAIVRQYALTALPPGTTVSVQRVIHSRRISCRGTILSNEGTSSTIRVRLEGLRRGTSFAPNDVVLLALRPSISPAPAPAAERSLPPIGRYLAPSGPASAGPNEVRLPMMFPLGTLAAPRR